MKIALGSMVTSSFFFQNEKVTTENIIKCFGEKMCLIIRNRETFENKKDFYAHRFTKSGAIMDRIP